MVLTLAGDDEHRLTARLSAILAEHVPDESRDFNLLELDGGELRLEELRAACDAMPFLGDTRVVVVRGLLRRFGEKDGEESGGKAADAAFVKDLKAYLPSVPPSTLLIFVERRKLGRSAAANALRAGTELEELLLPVKQELPAYIARQAREQGARIEPGAASLLASVVGESPSRLEPELAKLLAYKGGEGALTERDVRLLVDVPIEIAVWDLTDALFAHDAARSLGALRGLLDAGQVPQMILGAIASQVRNLVVAEEFRGARPEKVAAATGLKAFSAGKALQALRGFGPGEPARLLRALLDVDLAFKCGRTELGPALEHLVVSACERRL